MSDATARRRSRVRSQAQARPAWSGLAIVVEAIVLLLFLVGSLAVLTQLFASAAARGRQGRDLAAAVSLATTTAERFAADPATAEGTSTEDGLIVVCDVEPEKRAAGTLYHATVTVLAEGSDEPIYVLATARYQREVA